MIMISCTYFGHVKRNVQFIAESNWHYLPTIANGGGIQRRSVNPALLAAHIIWLFS